MSIIPTFVVLHISFCHQDGCMANDGISMKSNSSNIKKYKYSHVKKFENNLIFLCNSLMPLSLYFQLRNGITRQGMRNIQASV